MKTEMTDLENYHQSTSFRRCINCKNCKLEYRYGDCEKNGHRVKWDSVCDDWENKGEEVSES